ncbi:hypothetical protein A4X09_0g7018 [Tilletia walkeri]|uniref:Protein kinase domain-containing protein n=1 Tax=Tilletia walkeri TaxID=117179 RepID=A0A8X7N2W4_9BASI|nr:hypothetical protein A4X09_0g7018 [Tilletia walkeri]
MATPSRASVLVPDPSDATRLALSPDSKNSRVQQRPRRPRSGQPAQPAPKRARAADGPDAEDNAADVVPESPEDADDDVPVRLPRNSWVAPHEWRACGRYRRSSKAEVLGEGAYARVVRVVDTFGGPDRARKRQEYDDDGPSSQLLFEVRTLLRLRTTADFDAAAALRRATVGSNSEDDGEDEERGESLESGSGSEEEGEGDKDGMDYGG